MVFCIGIPNLKFLPFQPFPRYRVGPKILKVGHVTPFATHLTEFSLFFLQPLVANLHTKFEVSSFNHSRDMGVPKFQKCVMLLLDDPFDPISTVFVETPCDQSAR